MVVRQIGDAFEEYLAENGDPELGEIVIAGGGDKPAFHPEEADINLYWWWSFGPYDHEPGRFLDYYLEKTEVEPDIVLCNSKKVQKEAEQEGFETLFLPLGTQAYRPLDLNRSGLGYAGSRQTKSGEKWDMMFGAFEEEIEFTVDSDLHIEQPAQLNMWYNTKLVTFGLHRGGQREWGMVNNRVFEALASGTPFIMREHPTVDDVLGFDFPYQVSSRKEVEELIESFRAEPENVLEEFQGYSKTVREEHSFKQRIDTLVEFLT